MTEELIRWGMLPLTMLIWKGLDVWNQRKAVALDHLVELRKEMQELANVHNGTVETLAAHADYIEKLEMAKLAPGGDR